MADPAPPAASGPDSASSAPSRRLTLGITGHRIDRLGEEALEPLRVNLASLFAAIEHAASGEEPCALRLVTSIADGADSIAAQAALARGWALDSILPFARDDYAGDFPAGAPKDLFNTLIAASGSVMELDGSRRGEHGESIAYERSGRVLLAQCDVLIAVWDGGPVRGRGGAAQIVAEAVQLDVPVIQLDPAGSHAPALLWDGLEELALGLDTVDSVARGSLEALPELVRALISPPVDASEQELISRFLKPRKPGFIWALAYPLLLMVMGVRRPRKTDFAGGSGEAGSRADAAPLCGHDAALGGRLQALLAPRFARADAAATYAAQLFRHGYVANFVLAALAVLLSLLGLALPPAAKPVLIVAELAIIGSILLRTRRGNRAGWHRAWLENRALAERLRCLAISARLGDVNPRGANQLGTGARQHDWVAWFCRATGRELGLPGVAISTPYLIGVRKALLHLVDSELAYLSADAVRMHRLEHRLHRLGTWLFALTAFTCIFVLIFKMFGHEVQAFSELSPAVSTGATIIGAALPAFGAAIYGIRMQGDFAGSAERSADLASKLRFLRRAIGEETPEFDNLSRCARGVTSLLTADVASWLHTTSARPLALPG